MTMTMTMKQGVLTWSPCQWPHSLSRASRSSLKAPKSFKPVSFFKIFASINGNAAAASAGEDKAFLQSLLPENDLKVPLRA